MIKVGLTGSIAVGKTYVCERLSELGCHVLDADKTARDVVAIGTPGLSEIVRQFGSDVLTPAGDLDRKKMGGIVFADKAKLAILNSIVHPLVIAEQDKWITEQERADPGGIAVIDAALMIESGGYSRFDKLIVVWCDPAIQLKRLMLRDSMDKKTASVRIASQMPQDEKKRFADYLIDTSGGYTDTSRQVEILFVKLRVLSEVGQ